MNNSSQPAHLLRRVLYVGGSVVSEPGRRAPLFGRPREVLRDEPVQPGPALELQHLAGGRLGEALVAGLGGEGEAYVAGAYREKMRIFKLLNINE